MKLDWKEVVKPTAVLFVICAVVSAALAGTNLVTKDRIAQQAEETAQQSRQIVLPEAEEFSEQEGYYTGSIGGETVGYVFETEAKGYGGTVSVMTGISAEGSVTGVVILSHEETPGLGANAEKEDFLQQYQQALRPSAALVKPVDIARLVAKGAVPERLLGLHLLGPGCANLYHSAPSCLISIPQSAFPPSGRGSRTP